MPRPPVLLLLVLALAGCAEHPRETVLQIDPDNRRYRTRQCREARQAALDYEDHILARTAVGIAGNLLVPFAGTAASLAMTAERDRERQRLNARVASACLADPVNQRPRRPARRSNARGGR